MDAPFGATDSPDEIRAAYETAAAVRAQRRAARRPYVYLYHRHRPADDALAADAFASVHAWRRGEPGSTESLVDRLTRDDIDLRVAVLEFLRMAPARGFRGRDIATAVIDNLRHPFGAVSSAALWLCQQRHVPGAAEAALERAVRDPGIDPSFVALATKGRDANAAVGLAIRLIEETTDPNRRSRLQDILISVARTDETAAGVAAREALHNTGVRWRPLVPASESRDVQAAIRAGGTPRPVEEMVALAEELFDGRGQVIGLGILARCTRNDALVERIIADYGWENSPNVRTALLLIGGAAAERWLLAALPDLHLIGRAELLWALEAMTLDDVLRKCRDAGLIAETPDFMTIKRVRYDHSGGYDDCRFSLFDPFIDLLVRAGAAVSFNYDPSTEIRYDRLIRRFAYCMPWLRLEALSERVLRIEGEHREMGRVLQFVAAGRRYRLEMEGSSSTYLSAPEIVVMLNQVLADAGREERFLPVRRDERWVFVFARPDVARELADSIYLPLDDQPELMNRAVKRFLARRR